MSRTWGSGVVLDFACCIYIFTTLTCWRNNYCIIIPDRHEMQTQEHRHRCEYYSMAKFHSFTWSSFELVTNCSIPFLCDNIEYGGSNFRRSCCWISETCLNSDEAIIKRIVLATILLSNQFHPSGIFIKDSWSENFDSITFVIGEIHMFTKKTSSDQLGVDHREK